MMKCGRYIAQNDESYLHAYHIVIDFKETPKSYILTMVENNSRYGAPQIEPMFAKSKRVVIGKSGDEHALIPWGDNSFTLYPYRCGVPYLFRIEAENDAPKCGAADEGAFNEGVFDIIEPALQAEGYTVLEGDCDTAYLRSPDGGVTFMLKIAHIQ